MSHNRLADETSPYLLQHKDNPVHWWPWGEAAFAEARASGRPVLLSVGYAACHWCHVMAHESFENPAIAARMNALFVNIKVDREERPDVDALYMGALALMGEPGGWPLTLFLTPDGRPFTGGTYFPPTPRHGRPGFPAVLEQVSALFHADDGRVARAATGLCQALEAQARGGGSGEGPDADGPDGAGAVPTLADQDAWARRLLDHLDPVHGGLAGAPKFPMVTALDALWRAFRRTGDESLGDAVRLSLTRMGQGGIYDHLGGGFARYSTDERWLAPHFEKMLYDNAQVLDLMVRVWARDRTPLLLARIEETVAWVEREMIADNGAFAATLDADSEGEEGRFYVWREAEVDAVLDGDPETAALVKAAYDVTAAGNWEGRVILNRSGPQPVPPPGWSTDDVEAALARGRARLLAARDTRVRPARDDKVLADWNGLMIAALARAAAVLDRPAWRTRAETAFAAVVRDLGWRDEAGHARLSHAWRQGRRRKVGVLDDLGHMALAALALHRGTGTADYLEHARAWVDTALALYGDTEAGGFFLAAADAPDLIVRPKSAMDTPAPSGNGALALALARLAAMTGDETDARQAEATARAFAAVLPRGYPHTATLLAALEALARCPQVVVVGRSDDPGTAALMGVAAASPDPDLVLTRVTPGDAVPAGHPAAGKTAVADQATAYVCRGPTCGAPVTDPAVLARVLD
ncbi:thioredoxin domain-containing protein [Roseospira visakhapatnamensis]|uniref:Spermatogenesis-associated protein 20-like TRX domain-containing protein n=1 Tax=Roseospira visakhapatnamensis TaxID=390880 RepID=A0A7W6W8L4_9PROT|nr:thioredoxin domain-containing protein [Roseospira visakhapatnamensis]MBB4264512.1 hypothetical protein [Roseospira visakhapatnamensis]